MKRVIVSAEARGPQFLVIGVYYKNNLLGFLTGGNAAQQDISDTTKAHGPRYCTSMRSANAVIHNNSWGGRVLNNKDTIMLCKSSAFPYMFISGRGAQYILEYNEPLIDYSYVEYKIYSVDEALNLQIDDPSILHGDTLEDMYPGISDYEDFFSCFAEGFLKGGLFKSSKSSLEVLLQDCVDMVVDMLNLDLRIGYKYYKYLLEYIPDQIYDEVISKLDPKVLELIEEDSDIE